MFAVVLGGAAVFRRPHSIACWAFAGGMLALAAEGVLAAMIQRSPDPLDVRGLLTLSLAVKALLPGFWICFSLTYSRGNGGEFLRRWKWVLALSVILPAGIVGGWHSDLARIVFAESGDAWGIHFGTSARALGVLVLMSSVLVLVNLERTARAAIGTARWRIKYLFLGVALIFGVKIYVESQALLYSSLNPSLAIVEDGALLIGCALMLVAYLREGFGDVDIYPSQAVLSGSLTVILVGFYLLVVGILAQVVALLGGAAGFPAQAFLVLLGIVGMAVLLLSDRFRAGIRRSVARNFRRPRHDFRQVWTRFTQRTSSVMDRGDLCREATKLISETFEALTVVMFLIEEGEGRLVPCVSTFEGKTGKAEGGDEVLLESEDINFLREKSVSFDLKTATGDWVDRLRSASPVQFSHGGHRRAVPLLSGSRLLGLVVLADRVNGIPYSQEEQDLLKCIADQFAAALLNRHLSEEVMQVREMEAFQTMSTFFVHDLKNAANSLNLMLQNLPNHFDDPEFREDALRAVGKSVGRINEMILKLGALRQNLDMHPETLDLSSLVEEVLDSLKGSLKGIELKSKLAPRIDLTIDRERIRSVVTNLIVNAREAVDSGGFIQVTTSLDGDEAIIEVKDNGCGMDPGFIREALFRPFRSTKSKGLGIGLFQSKMTVEAHQGQIRVESTPGEGTSIRVLLPHH